MNYATDGIELIGSIDVDEMARWITAISFDEWPQQHRLEDGKIRPAMQTDLYWHGFREQLLPVLWSLAFSVVDIYQPMLSVVMPGHSIPAHIDEQAPYFAFRIHVPIVTNAQAFMTIADKEYHLAAGKAYAINTRISHAIANRGDTPRIHLMFDVRRADQ